MAHDAGTALALTAVAVGGFYATATMLPFEIALWLAQPAQGAIAVGLTLGLREGNVRQKLGLNVPHPQYLLAALLIGLTAWYVNVRIVAVLSPPEGEVQRLDELVSAPSLAGALVAIAVFPAICEELIFRGVLARGLATRIPVPLAMLGSAALFALYHVSLTQAVPTFTLGLMFGILAIRSDSVFPSMLGHFLNNAIAILITREFTGVAETIDANPSATLGVSCAVLAGGIVLASGQRPKTKD